MSNTKLYSVYGLIIEIPFACPILEPALSGSIPDVRVWDAPVPNRLDGALVRMDNWEAEPDRFLWNGGSRSGRFLVEKGSQILLERGAEAREEILAFHFLDAVLAAILRQRGCLVLHANAAVTPLGAVAVSGISGAGKSTTLAKLIERGCLMLADDITALRLRGDGRIEVLPGIPQIHLCMEAARELGRDLSAFPQYPWKRWKAAVPTHQAMMPRPVSLSALYLLNSHGGEEVHCRLLAGLEKFRAIQDCIYGPMLPEEHLPLFPVLTSLASSVNMYRLHRPSIGWTADDVADRILGYPSEEKEDG